jgi:hypothetical protein
MASERARSDVDRGRERAMSPESSSTLDGSADADIVGDGEE